MTTLHTDLAQIADDWPHMLHGCGRGGRSSDPSRPPLPTEMLTIRDEAYRTLRSWAQVIMEDRDLHSGPRTNDVPGICQWLTIHADWAACQDYGPDMADEVASIAHQVHAATWREHAETVLIGPCPREIGDGITCAEPVRATAGDWSALTRCRGCGHSDTIEGWQVLILGQLEPVTVEDIAELLHTRLGIRWTPQHIRRLVRDRHLPAVTTEPITIDPRVAIITAAYRTSGVDTGTGP